MEVLKLRQIITVSLFILLVIVLPQPLAADAIQMQEREIKAGLLYSFLKYTKWPSTKMAGADAMVICLFGGDPFNGYLNKARDRTVQQLPITVKSINSGEQAGSCNMLFISASAKGNWPELSSSLSGKDILTVGDFDGFASSGGMLEFSRNGSRIAVLLNKSALVSAQLSVQDRLLRLVTVVKGKGD